MDAHVIALEPKMLNISIMNADIGILYIIQQELLKESKISFAGVILKHPLTNEIWMRVNSSTNPLEEMKKATDLTIKNAQEFKELFNSKLQVN